MALATKLFWSASFNQTREHLMSKKRCDNRLSVLVSGRLYVGQ